MSVNRKKTRYIVQRGVRVGIASNKFRWQACRDKWYIVDGQEVLTWTVKSNVRVLLKNTRGWSAMQCSKYGRFFHAR